ncbi:MAG: Gx transporter family protein [Clostridia bacterium]
MTQREKTQRIALCGLLLSLMLILGYVESMIPVAPGIPGIKLGLSNGVLVFAVYLLGIPNAIILMVLKVLLSGILFSGVSAMMYGFAGGVLSLLGMILLSRIKSLSPIVVSAVGGLLHNVGQVALAMVILGTPKLIYYMAILMLVGLATGAATGAAAYGVMRTKGLRGKRGG